MRHAASAISISWIPSEAITGMTRLPFDLSLSHYDPTPPDRVVPDDLEMLRSDDRFRFANHLSAWIEVTDGRVVSWGQEGGGLIGSTTLRLGRHEATFAAVGLPDVRPEPRVAATKVTFSQTAGGRTGVPAPRRVSRPPFVQVSAPLAWTTLSLTLHADGRADIGLEGASPFPRHWLYGPDGTLTAKSGLIDFDAWYRRAFGRHSPWGDEDTPAFVASVGTALERALSEQLMKGGEEPSIEKVPPGSAFIQQGSAGTDLFVVLDGLVRVDVDGQALGELGPGAIVGERAILEGGPRTSTLTAITPVTVARASAAQIDGALLAELAEGHRREERDG